QEICMGQAKQRGSREERVALAPPKAARPDADARRRAYADASARALGIVLRTVLGKRRRSR
ncbi:hypothetical protein, partial [Paraburkholderia sp. SIMBA_053]|uniref:hypothetical protein n=1 Tax=Paraburkholderia sp. SIMBA_053 TaxID=3085794 RepID=UPI00397968AA